MRQLVIGDIHGGYKALLQVLERSKFDNDKDRLIFLGDYVDGWSESDKVIDHLIELKKTSRFEHIFLCGNHDIWMRDWLIDGKRDYVWEYNGGESTIDAYVKSGKNTDKEHIEFFKNLRSFYIDRNNKLFVHAGIESNYGVTQDSAQVHFWSRLFWNSKISGTNVYQQGEDMYNEIYIGHTPTINYVNRSSEVITEPINVDDVWNMDTGAGWGGKLSLMDTETKELIQSDATEILYENEKGRRGY